MDSIDNHNVDITNRPNPFINRPKGKIFTLEEDMHIFYGKVAGEQVKQIAERLHGKRTKQITSRWEILLKHDPDLLRRFQSANKEQDSLPQIDLNPLEEVQALQKLRMDVLEERKQLSKWRNPESRLLREFRLVFTSPNSLGEVFIRRGLATIYTINEDKLIIDGKITWKSNEQIAKGLLGRSTIQIQNRWLGLKKTNPHLENIVKQAISERARLLDLKPVKPSVQIDPLSFLVPDLSMEAILKV